MDEQIRKQINEFQTRRNVERYIINVLQSAIDDEVANFEEDQVNGVMNQAGCEIHRMTMNMFGKLMLAVYTKEV